MVLSTKLHRASTIAELFKCHMSFISDESMKCALSFTPKDGDIFISPYPKCGTTWIQQIIHGLRTGGSMDFNEINEVIPWLEISHDIGIDLDQHKPTLPRVFKSHLAWENIPKKNCKYICLTRNPKDVLVSFYKFIEGWWFEPGAISIELFTKAFFINGRETYWTHLASWWPHRNDPNVLMFSYEELKEKLPEYIHIISDFIGCKMDQDLFDLILKQSSIKFMHKHKSKFDEHLTRNTRDKPMGLPAGGNSMKIRNGNIGDYKTELPKNIQSELDDIWHKQIESKFNLISYEALIKELKKK
ncbi:MAG: sulfotransferase domain-containing protein [bacterium]|nr:sulfotransferase domain-containing protein [bacterium]